MPSLGDVLQPHLTARHRASLSSVMVISHSCCRRPRWIGVETAVTVPGDGAQEVGVVVHPDDGAAAVLGQPDVSGHAGEALDDGAVDAAVDDAPRLQQLVVDLQPGPSAVGGQLEVRQADSLSKPAPRPGGRSVVTDLCLHVALATHCGVPGVIVGHGQKCERPSRSRQRRRPKITRRKRRRMIANGNILVVDVRDAPEVEQSGKVAGAVHVPRGMLEFRADPESPYHDSEFRQGQDGDRVLRIRRALGAVRQALRNSVTPSLQPAGLQDWAEAAGDRQCPQTENADGPHAHGAGPVLRVDRGSLQPSGLRRGPVVQVCLVR